jgi:type I restriction enzyme S subunit
MEIKSLKEIASLIRTGKTPSTKEDKYFNGEINWYSPGDLDKTKYLFTAKRTITQQAIEDKKAITFPKDTLLVGCIGDIGKLGITSELSSSNQQLTGILPNNETNVSYLYYWFKGNKKVLENYSNNAVVPILNNRTLETVKIPLPPLDQQKKIASILDAADAYRQKTKALIEKYDELTKSLFLDMFGDPVSNPKGWRKHKLGDICHMKAGKFVKASDIISENNSNMYSCFGGNGLRGYVESFTHEGEFLLIGRQGALCGNVKKVKGKFHATEHAIVCLPRMEYETLWLYHMLVMINLNKYATGAAQPGLNVGTLVELEVIFVPYALQNQFAERIQAIEAQKAQAQASLAQAEDLFNSLLQRAFKGELTD